jgi:putative DNA primase/helicase
MAIIADKKINDNNWLTPKFDNIPEELKTQPWAVWIAEPRKGQEGKFDKAPRNPKTGYNIATSKPKEFGTFDEAVTAYASGKYTGVGVLLTGNGIIGVDIDNYIEAFTQNPEVKVWVENAVKKGVYSEKSPSGNGLRLFLRGQLPDSGRKHGPLEIYGNARFLTVTGCAYPTKKAGA